MTVSFPPPPFIPVAVAAAPQPSPSHPLPNNTVAPSPTCPLAARPDFAAGGIGIKINGISRGGERGSHRVAHSSPRVAPRRHLLLLPPPSLSPPLGSEAGECGVVWGIGSVGGSASASVFRARFCPPFSPSVPLACCCCMPCLGAAANIEYLLGRGPGDGDLRAA